MTVSNIATPRIALCFFGITRSLGYTIHSIRRNILQPARATGTVSVFCHFFDQKRIQNPRSGEFGDLRPDEYDLLAPDQVEIEPPDLCLEARGFDALKTHGDAWDDDFRSLRNLVHQLHSLDRVTTAAEAWTPDLIFFARPDLTYHQSLAPVFTAARSLVGSDAGPVATLPRWQHWEDGVNDRFALCTPVAAAAYGHRIREAEAHCDRVGGPLHAERLLKDVLERAGAEIRLMPQRASRTRIDGTLQYEDFSPPGASHVRFKLSNLHGKYLRSMARAGRRLGR